MWVCEDEHACADGTFFCFVYNEACASTPLTVKQLPGSEKRTFIGL